MVLSVEEKKAQRREWNRRYRLKHPDVIAANQRRFRERRRRGDTPVLTEGGERSAPGHLKLMLAAYPDHKRFTGPESTAAWFEALHHEECYLGLLRGLLTIAWVPGRDGVPPVPDQREQFRRLRSLFPTLYDDDEQLGERSAA